MRSVHNKRAEEVQSHRLRSTQFHYHREVNRCFFFGGGVLPAIRRNRGNDPGPENEGENGDSAICLIGTRSMQSLVLLNGRKINLIISGSTPACCLCGCNETFICTASWQKWSLHSPPLHTFFFLVPPHLLIFSTIW